MTRLRTLVHVALFAALFLASPLALTSGQAAAQGSVGAAATFEEPRQPSPFKGSYNWLIYYDWLNGYWVWAEPRIDRNGVISGPVLTNQGATRRTGPRQIGTVQGSVTNAGLLSVTQTAGYGYASLAGLATLTAEGDIDIVTVTATVTWTRSRPS